MKKITNIVMVLMLMMSIVSLALAVQADEPTTGDPNNSSVDNQTTHEIQTMNDPIGAQIRLLQLEKSIITNILKGDMTIQVIQGFTTVKVNTTTLQTILEYLTENLSKVRTVDPNANDSVYLFVSLKHNATNLTKQFRETLRFLLDNETIALIKAELKDLYNSPELQNCSMKIRHWVRQFNRNQLYRLFEFVGEKNTSLLEQYLNGDVNLTQVRLHLYPMINHMTKEKQYDLYCEIKAEHVRNTIQSQESLEHMRGPRGESGHGGRP